PGSYREQFLAHVGPVRIILWAMRYTVSLFALLVVTGSQAANPPAAKAPAFSVFEASISDMQAAMKSGRTTSHEIVQQYLTRIATYEDLLHAATTVKQKALEDVDAMA